MAGDWIKVESITPDKPEIFQMAEILGIDADEVTGKFLRLWIWADQQTFNGNAKGVTQMLLDRITGLKGFTDAMVSVGWIKIENGSAIFPNFERHNGKPAKSRAETNRRVTKHRNETKMKQECNGKNVTETEQKALPEKRREEYLNSAFEQLWDQFDSSLGNKGAKKTAFVAFKKLKPDDSLRQEMLLALKSQIENKRSAQDQGLFTEKFQHVERWIKNRRWEDELPEQEQQSTGLEL